MTSPHPEHGVEELCAAGAELYERALREGRVPGADAERAPCLVGFGLLHPAVADPGRLEPVAPVVALHRLLRRSGERIAHERRREERLAAAFEPLMRVGGHRTATADTPATTVLSGSQQINEAITEAMARASRELLTVQPHTHTGERRHTAEAVSLERDQALLDRGCRIRTLYQHTVRHSPTVLSRYEQLEGDVEARSLDEVTDRLIVVDRTVAFIPADRDGGLALEVRHPALLGFFGTTFDRLWRLADPMYPVAVHRPSLNGVTPRQQAVASLLVEGHTDAVIAERLGLNVRTARVHIAKLASTLGSGSRAQLGYLIGRSGILDQER
ncbi:DNA-binding CsgD family transcriptional regulator/sugar-specific transcriptional regulator TrmB [Streptomyces sp. V3I8]|uniref:helix-turn-helix transcriptional regulator n=1 Tax=Streptomyces sp. V3I8 TaxID=3042279 RepID=UPI0027879BF5|nr:helix-turn-helix transcriptional regulator [Streptomyces sp. V3I8]MDQ1037748.1 DNA-binding CsgD family transcriptional regulator/sugar-specific transcriptional regulator TrmB [Streptomyces sp. V3I8]